MTYECSQFQTPTPDESRVVQLNASHFYEKLMADFGQATSAPIELASSEGFEEWQISQAVQLNAEHFDSYHWIKTKGTMKLVMGDPKSGSYQSWVLFGPTEFAVPYFVEKRDGLMRRSYFILGLFRQN